MTNPHAALVKASLHLAEGRTHEASLCLIEVLIVLTAQVDVLTRQQDAGRSVREPKWQRNDQIRYRAPAADGVHFVAILQRPNDEATRPGWWDAMILRALSANSPMVGSSIQVREGDPNATVAHFDD